MEDCIDIKQFIAEWEKDPQKKYHLDNARGMLKLEKVISQQAAEIERLKSEREWISVDERLPMCGTQVFVAAGGELEIAWREPDDERPSGWKWIVDYDWEYTNVTHWMPLPDGPTV